MERFTNNNFVEQGRNEKLRRHAALLAVLSSFSLTQDIEYSETGAELENPMLAKMVEVGKVKGDCEQVFSEELRQMTLVSKNEVAFAAVYNENGECRIVPLASGNGAGVSITPQALEELKKEKDITRTIFYHTHPYSKYTQGGEPHTEERVGEVQHGIVPPAALSGPSSDDYMVMTRKEALKMEASDGSEDNITEERVVTPLGIWRYGIRNTKEALEKEDEARKLGSLFNYKTLHSDDWEERKSSLESLEKGYLAVAESAHALQVVGEKNFSEQAIVDYKNGSKELLASELEKKIEVAKDFSKAMSGIGYSVEFTLHPKYTLGY